jgi:membrane protease YdiL (CAAX protease family)
MAFTNPGQYVLFSPQMFFLLATILVLLKNRLHPHDIGLKLEPAKKNVSMGLIAGLLPFLGLVILNIILGTIIKTEGKSIHYDMSAWMIFSYFVFAPIAEELFFRGVIFHTLRQNYSLFISMLTSTLLFSAAHSSIMIGPLFLGVITAWMVYKTGSIIPGMIFHSISNALPWFYTNHCPHLQPFESLFFFRF